MILGALDSVLNSTRSGGVIWKKVGPESYETITVPKITIQFHYPQMGNETSTGADVAVVTFGDVATSFFSGTDGMTRVQSILRAAFPEWEEHLSQIEKKIENFAKQLGNSK